MSKKSIEEARHTLIYTKNTLPPDNVGDRIRFARNRAGMSAEALALEVGCSQSSISQYERGVRDPSPDMLIKISEALGCSVYSLYTPSYFEKYRFSISLKEIKDDEPDFNPYTRNYRITEDEYVRFSLSFEQLTIEGRMKVYEYLEDIAKIPKYLGEGWSSGNDEKM